MWMTCTCLAGPRLFYITSSSGYTLTPAIASLVDDGVGLSLPTLAAKATTSALTASQLTEAADAAAADAKAVGFSAFRYHLTNLCLSSVCIE